MREVKGGGGRIEKGTHACRCEVRYSIDNM